MQLICSLKYIHILAKQPGTTLQLLFGSFRVNTKWQLIWTPQWNNNQGKTKGNKNLNWPSVSINCDSWIEMYKIYHTCKRKQHSLVVMVVFKFINSGDLNVSASVVTSTCQTTVAWFRYLHEWQLPDKTRKHVCNVKKHMFL